MVTAICVLATRAILTTRLFCGARIDPRAFVDRLNAVHDNAVTNIDPRFDDDIGSDGLAKLHLSLESTELWRFNCVGGFTAIGGFGISPF